MKATTVAVFALTAATVSAQPIIVPREYYYAGVPRAMTDLEARWHFSFPKIHFPKIHLPKIDWHKVGNFAKTAANIGASVLLKRMEEDELYARGFIDNEDLVTRDFDDDYYLEARDFDGEYLEARDFDDDDGDRPPHRHPHDPPRLSRHGANHKKVGKYGKLWAAKGTAHRGYAARRPSRPAGNLDDLN
ncbi:hypothetical protein M378DRAFT_179141 [Amanita muscaria Koide BX008]|uniref:Uncharacterized protein n=1 Tax=Amanita muscaria (strain Koide BX008) TaxID=946122 RepID=A0A0C2X4P6_AMAMK|nr:hypothetical protein M378DRAFT_179141 [Amanita muscaria Koide BX008]